MSARLWLLVRYALSGVVGIVVQVASLYIWVSVLGLASSYLLGVTIGFIIALAIMFVLQKYWAFRDTTSGRTPQQLFSYTAVALSGLALNAVLLAAAKGIVEHFSIDFFHGWYIAAQIVVVGVVAASNFTLNFLITFRDARNQGSTDK